MRWLVTADVHLSNSLPYCRVNWKSGVSDRLRDFAALFGFIAESGRKNGATGLLILGDLFDRNLLDAITLKYASRLMRELQNAYDRIVILPGNHENYDARSIHFTSEWLSAFRRVKVVSQPTIADQFSLIPYMPLPRLRREITQIHNKKSGVLCLHTTFAGSTEFGHTFQTGLRKQDVEGWELVLTGHIHKAQKLPHGINGRYVGSPMPIDFRDQTTKRLWLIDGNTLTGSVVVPPAIALPFKTLNVHLGEGKEVRAHFDDLPGSGYLKFHVHGRRDVVDRFITDLKRSVDATGYRYVGYEPVYQNERVKERSADMAQEERTDLRRALRVWLRKTEGDRDRATLRRLEQLGQELLEQVQTTNKTTVHKRASLEGVSLTVRNFGLIRKAKELPLRRVGTVLIVGRNSDMTGADSNGSGKTTLFKAITWLWYGRTIYGEVGDDVVRHGTKEAVVKMTVELDGEKIVLVRRKKLREPVALAMWRGSHWIKGTSTELQPDFDNVIGLSFESYRNAVLFGQDDVKRFADPRTLDGTRKAIFRDILGLGRLEAAREAAKANEKSTKELIDKCERSIIRLTTTIEQSSVEMLRKQSADHVSALRADRARTKKDLEDIRHRRVEMALPTGAEVAGMRRVRDKATAQVQVARNRLAQVQTRLSAARGKAADQRIDAKVQVSTTEEQHHQARMRLTALDGDRCPVCSTPLNSASVKDYRHQLHTEIAELKAKLIADRARLDALQKDEKCEADEKLEKRLVETIGELQKKQERLNSKCDELSSHEADVAALDANEAALVKEFNVIRDKLRKNPYAKLLDETLTKRRIARRELDERKTEKVALEEHTHDIQFWIDGFGASGLQSWIMDAVVPGLNERINEHLAVLSDGGMRVFIDTESHTKRGQAREKFSLSTLINDEVATILSGGEQRKVEIAVGLGLMDLVTKREGTNINLLMLDEVFDGLDATGKDRVMLLLSTLRSKRGTVLVVSHDPELKSGNVFDRVWRVVRRGGSSVVKWSR